MVVLSIIPEIKELFLGTAISGVMKGMLTPKHGDVISERLPSDGAQPAGQSALGRRCEEVLPWVQKRLKHGWFTRTAAWKRFRRVFVHVAAHVIK